MINNLVNKLFGSKSFVTAYQYPLAYVSGPITEVFSSEIGLYNTLVTHDANQQVEFANLGTTARVVVFVAGGTAQGVIQINQPRLDHR